MDEIDEIIVFDDSNLEELYKYPTHKPDNYKAISPSKMIIYLDSNFEPATKENATLAKLIPDDGSRPYFLFVKQGKIEGLPPEKHPQSTEA
jgi:hypothetical protein